MVRKQYVYETIFVNLVRVRVRVRVRVNLGIQGTGTESALVYAVRGMGGTLNSPSLENADLLG